MYNRRGREGERDRERLHTFFLAGIIMSRHLKTTIPPLLAIATPSRARPPLDVRHGTATGPEVVRPIAQGYAARRTTSLTQRRKKVRAVFIVLTTLYHVSDVNNCVYVIDDLLPCIFCCFSVAEASGESADESSCEDEVIPVKRHKPLQARHSLLEDLDDASKALLDVSKRPKRDDNMVSGYVTVM